METLFTLTPVVLASVPLVVGLVAVAKEVGLPSRFAPLASLLCGIGFVALAGATWQVAVAQGIIVGLLASGLWSGGKALLASGQ